MKKITTLLAVMLIVLFSLSTNAQNADEMKAFQASIAPDEVHKMIAKWDGKWTSEISMWMNPGGAPEKYTGTTVNKMILGGRYQESKHTSTMMGMPFEGVGTLGWDKARKVLVSSWIDNFGTGMMYMEGTWDNASKSATFKGKSTDPASGKEVEVKEVFKVIDDNTQSLQMFMVMGGTEAKTMEIIFKRAK